MTRHPADVIGGDQAPQCSKGHGPMVPRPAGTREQKFCGTWYECAYGWCRNSVLHASAELTAVLTAGDERTVR